MGKRSRNARRKKKPGEIPPRRLRVVGEPTRQTEQQPWESRAWKETQARRALEALNPLVTFVIPTKGRATLDRALASLVMQTNERWTAMIVGDGFMPQARFSGKRVEALAAPRTGSAGLLRNLGMEASQSQAPWFAFLDDDDEVTPDYVERLERETADPPGAAAALFLFRMLDKDSVVKPHPVTPTIGLGWVGISFAVRREWPLEHGVEFIKEEPSIAMHEDITYVESIQAAGGVVHVAPLPVAYLVRGATLEGAV